MVTFPVPHRLLLNDRMPQKSDYLEFLTEWLAPLGAISSRAMFGGYCLYCDGAVFALVADNTLYLKVDDATRLRFELLGLKPFRPYEDKPEVMQYYPPPADFFEDRDVMRDWGGQAVEVGRRAQLKKKKKRGDQSRPR
jgi:DNA transformation protein